MKIDSILSQGLGGAQLNVGASMAAPGSAAAPSFAQALGQTFDSALASIQGGEAAAIQGLQGALPASKVVEAVTGAQRTLQSALAIRDKAVAAYQEIARMPI